MLSTSPMKFALYLGVVPCLLLAAACADPDGAFDEFVDRSAKAGAASSTSTGGDGGAPGCVVPAVGEIDGDYVMVLSAKLSPKKPIVMSAALTSADDGGKLSVTMHLQPLLATDRATPVGAAIDPPAFTVADDGSFTMDVPSTDIDGTANPITGNTLTGVAAQVVGTMCAPADFICGTVTGTVTTPPVSLDGSTFTLQPIADPASPPETFINCNKDLANPLQ